MRDLMEKAAHGGFASRTVAFVVDMTVTSVAILVATALRRIR